MNFLDHLSGRCEDVAPFVPTGLESRNKSSIRARGAALEGVLCPGHRRPIATRSMKAQRRLGSPLRLSASVVGFPAVQTVREVSGDCSRMASMPFRKCPQIDGAWDSLSIRI